jgi:lipopolysaccharide transport system ATP-binding protein
LYKFDQLHPGKHNGDLEEQSDIIWALRDVSFDVKQGEVLGIIGKNGAGKSTLLKILSRITEPSSGIALIRGNVSSLLEVGTGFHPELTGRENVYVNGTILGMTKKEVDRKFDEIVYFSGIDKFIDTPVKRYSSGMSVRLAFAVAAHLEPEVLIVDEVLAVGDYSFQRKCLGKMGQIAASGRTVLFVSHNMGAVGNLCETGLWLENGRVQMHGDIQKVVKAYLKSIIPSDGLKNSDKWARTGSGEAFVSNAILLDKSGQPCNTFRMGDALTCVITIDIKESVNCLDNIHLGIRRADTGVNILHVMNQDCGLVWEDLVPGQRSLRVEIPDCLLYPGSYEIAFLISSGNKQLDYIESALSFEMVENQVSQRSLSFSYFSKSALVHVPSKWVEINGSKMS